MHLAWQQLCVNPHNRRTSRKATRRPQRKRKNQPRTLPVRRTLRKRSGLRPPPPQRKPDPTKKAGANQPAERQYHQSSSPHDFFRSKSKTKAGSASRAEGESAVRLRAATSKTKKSCFQLILPRAQPPTGDTPAAGETVRRDRQGSGNPCGTSSSDSGTSSSRASGNSSQALPPLEQIPGNTTSARTPSKSARPAASARKQRTGWSGLIQNPAFTTNRERDGTARPSRANT